MIKQIWDLAVGDKVELNDASIVSVIGFVAHESLVVTGEGRKHSQFTGKYMGVCDHPKNIKISHHMDVQGMAMPCTSTL